jgi:predicted RNA-binding Zn ribbon-like protein
MVIVQSSWTSTVSYQLVAGELCLDFINTLDNRPRLELVIELLETYDDLLQWSVEAGALPSFPARALCLEAQREPVSANAALKNAIRLRECLYRIFTQIARGKPTSPTDLAALDTFRVAAQGRLQLIARTNGFRLEWRDKPVGLEAPLWRVARSATDLLTSPDLQLVRECEDDACRWLFVDRSRNHSRRWCDMKVCGNRIKARTFYRQHKKTASEASR